MEILAWILVGILALYGTGVSFLLYAAVRRAKEQKNDVENFIKSLYSELISFKQAVENVSKYNVLVYDESVFEIMNLFKGLKSTIETYMSKYDEYANYIYTEDQIEEPKAMIGEVLRPGGSNGPARQN